MPPTSERTPTGATRYRLTDLILPDSSVDVVPYSAQAEEKARVGVRLLGHLLRGATLRSGVQTEIIEIPLSERPVAVACCPVSGDLLVACEKTLVLFTLRRQNQQSLVGVRLLICSSSVCETRVPPVFLCPGNLADPESAGPSERLADLSTDSQSR